MFLRHKFIQHLTRGVELVKPNASNLMYYPRFALPILGFGPQPPQFIALVAILLSPIADKLFEIVREWLL